MPLPIKHENAKLMLYLDGPDWNGPTATIGGFSCGDLQSGLAILREAEDHASSKGRGGLIGPMDGDTWHAYRLVTQSDDRPTFLMEPKSGLYDQAAFEAAGFQTISEYFSASASLADIPTANAPEKGFSISIWDGSDPERLFTQVYRLSCAAFSKNPFYKDIDLSDFLAMYLPMVPMIKPDLVLFARDGQGDLQGFLFGIPDYAQGPETKTVILKTYASLAKGAGFALSTRFYANARQAGYETCIHALMHEDNLSALRSSMNGADIFRRYALMGKSLV